MFNHIPRIIGACESPPCGGKDFPGSFILPQVLSWAFLAVSQKVSLAGSRGSFSHPGVLPHKRNKDDKTTVVTRTTCLFSLSLETRVECGTTYESFQRYGACSWVPGEHGASGGEGEVGPSGS